jgi:hypothetical protein
MKKKFARALSMQSMIATTPAQVARANRPRPVANTAMPTIRWIQPHALTSRSNV